MCFDLSTLLTTIASASAGIVAILGGFIASKLISINGERDEITGKLLDIEDEIKYCTKILDDAQNENDEEDALSFILPHVDELLIHDVKHVYETEEHPQIALKTLVPYWEIAKEVYTRFQTAIQNGQSLNDDKVPINLAQDFRNDDFAYEICQRVGINHTRNARKAARESENRIWREFGYADPMPSLVEELEYTPSALRFGDGYRQNEKSIQEQTVRIGWLEIQRKQYVAKQRALEKPKGMVSGLVVFAVFSIFCIILPMVFLPFSTNDYTLYCVVKAAFLIVFTLGLIAIFYYLVWLLKWNQKKG